jgi:hypothetical protein
MVYKWSSGVTLQMREYVYISQYLKYTWKSDKASILSMVVDRAKITSFIHAVNDLVFND